MTNRMMCAMSCQDPLGQAVALTMKPRSIIIRAQRRRYIPK
jgi:hypothetical protein